MVVEVDEAAQLLTAPPYMHQQAKARVYSDEEWEAQKSNFKKLYKASPLRDVIIAMQRDYGFVAT